MFIPPRLLPRPRPRPIPFPRPREPRPRPRLNPAGGREGVSLLTFPGSHAQHVTSRTSAHLGLGHPWTGGTGSAPWSIHHNRRPPWAPHLLHTAAPERSRGQDSVREDPGHTAWNCVLCPLGGRGPTRGTECATGTVGPGKASKVAPHRAASTEGWEDQGLDATPLAG